MSLAKADVEAFFFTELLVPFLSLPLPFPTLQAEGVFVGDRGGNGARMCLTLGAGGTMVRRSYRIAWTESESGMYTVMSRVLCSFGFVFRCLSLFRGARCGGGLKGMGQRERVVW